MKNRWMACVAAALTIGAALDGCKGTDCLVDPEPNYNHRRPDRPLNRRTPSYRAQSAASSSVIASNGTYFPSSLSLADSRA